MSQHLQEMIDQLIQTEPLFTHIIQAPSLGEYLDLIFAWNPPDGSFPFRELLTDLIVQEAERLYGLVATQGLREQLQKSWALPTGEHLCIPKERETNNWKMLDGQRKRSVNSLLTQGMLLWAAKARSLGHSLYIPFATGRVSPGNINSGAFLEVGRDTDLIRMIQKRWNETPQYLIPASPTGDIRKKASGLSFDEQALLNEVLEIFDAYQEHFSDQVAVTHTHIMNKALPQGISQLTIDSQRVAVKFLATLLRDSNSVLHQIFADQALCKEFCEVFAGIPTGWDSGNLPFLMLVQRGNGALKVDDAIRMYETPEELATRLENEEIIEYGVLLFFAFLVEAGLLPIGGMFQCDYCTQIRDRAVDFLEKHFSDHPGISMLATMPVEHPIVTPVWGVDENTGDLLSALSFIDQGNLYPEEAEQILSVTGQDSMLLAAPTLLQFMRKMNAPLNERQIVEALGSDRLIIR